MYIEVISNGNITPALSTTQNKPTGKNYHKIIPKNKKRKLPILKQQKTL